MTNNTVENKVTKGTQMQPVLDAALSYLKLGYSVIPICRPIDKDTCNYHRKCEYPGKRPALKSWTEYQHRLPTEEEVRKWFKNDDYNLGIVTGRVSNLAVIDCDTSQAEDYLQGGGIPITATSRSARGAKYFFRMPEGVELKNRTNIVKGLDVRAEGGLIVVPPSIHASGVTYIWEPDLSPFETEPAELPTWLLTLLTEGKESSTVADPASVSNNWAVTVLTGSTEGSRNSTLTQLCGHLKSKALNKEETLAILFSVNNNNVPPLKLDEVTKIVDSIYSRDNCSTTMVPNDWCLSVSDFLKQETTPTEWLVQDFWMDRAVGFIGGHSKSYKSYLALCMSLCIASGKMFLGKYETKKTNVMYISEEGQVAGLQKRISWLCKHLNVPEETIGTNFFVSQRNNIQVTNPVWQQSIIDDVVKYKIGLVILDPLSRVSSAEENSRMEMLPVVNFIRDLSKNQGVSVMVVHHFRKTNGDGTSTGQQLRGTSDLHSMHDSALYVSKQREKLIYVKTEHREAEGKQYFIELVFNQDAGDVELRLVDSDEEKEKRKDDLKQRILEAIEHSSTGLTDRELKSKVKGNKVAKAIALKELAIDHEISVTYENRETIDKKHRDVKVYSIAKISNES